MEWTEEAIVIGSRRHGENGVILEVVTRARGRCLGLVRGGRSRTMRPVLQPGNMLSVTWRARLEDHLGQFRAEPLIERAGTLMMSRPATYGLQLLAAHLRLLPERDPHPRLYDALAVIVENLEDVRIAAELIVRFEVLLLDELGFGLDLTKCVATGKRQDLAYVSPKSGRAVSLVAGRPYDNRMLKLPRFLSQRLEGEIPSLGELRQGFELTGYFLSHRVLTPRGLTVSEERDGFIRQVGSGMAGS